MKLRHLIHKGGDAGGECTFFEKKLIVTLMSRGSKVQAVEPSVYEREVLAPEILNRKFTNNDQFIEAINKEQQGLWTATKYPQFEGLSFAELLSKAGRVKQSVKKNAHFAHLESMRQFRTSRVNLSQYPENFDWRNVNGTNYVSPVRDQENVCCFVFFATFFLRI